MNHNVYTIRVWFGKSYLKPYTEHYIDILNTRIRGQTTKLKKRGFDIIRYETLKKDN